MSPSAWADSSSDAGSYGYGYEMSVPVVMPTGEIIPMVPAQNWTSMASEEASAQCSEFQQGYQACYMWMTAMQQGVPVYPVVTSGTEDASDANAETEESEVKLTSEKPNKDAEKLNLESLLPPPADPPVGEAPPVAASLESMLFDTCTPSRDGALKPKGLPSGTTGSMKEQLRALRMVNPAAVFIVRGIKPLGTPVVQQLQQYFSQFGDVTNVYAPHSRVKLNKLPTYQRAPVSRWRVANTGFVVMSNAESVMKVLEHGPEHNICGVLVSVHEFHRHNSVDPDAEEEEEDKDADADEAAAEKSTSASSNHDGDNEGSVHSGNESTDFSCTNSANEGSVDFSSTTPHSGNEGSADFSCTSQHSGNEGSFDFQHGAEGSFDFSCAGQQGGAEGSEYFSCMAQAAGYGYDAEAALGEDAANLQRFFYMLSAEELLSAMPEVYDD